MYSIGQIYTNFKESTLRDISKSKAFIFLVGIPLIISGILVAVFEYTIGELFLKQIVPIVAFLVGLSLNAVILLLRYSSNSDASEKLVTEVRHISVYSIVSGVLIILVTLLVIASKNNFETSYSHIILPVVSFIMYSAILHYFMTILLLPARVSVIVENAE